MQILRLGFLDHAEKPEHIFHYSAAASELAPAESGSVEPALVHVIVEDKNARGRVDGLSSPTHRGYSQDLKTEKHWWQQDGSSGVTQVHAIAASGERRIELSAQAVRSPTHQLLNRENSDELDNGVVAVRQGGAFQGALQEAAGSGGYGEPVVLLGTQDSLFGGTATFKGPLQRR